MILKLYSLCCFFLIHLGGIAQSNCSSYSTYFGGTQFDEIRGVCLDENKNSYFIGNTFSTDLPITSGLINDSHSGNYDVFITKFDSCGSLIWCTYFGTSGFESGEKIKLANDGNLVFCGYSSGLNLPVSSGCFQSSNNGGYDCFLTKITPGGHIVWSTYFGKGNGDFAYDLAIDGLDNIVIGGTTTSPNLYTTTNSFQQNINSNTDAFIARFSKDGVLKWSTYYGGSGAEDIHALTIDNNYNIIGVGGTLSSNLNVSASAYQIINEGNTDAYLLKLDSNCVRIFSTYLGGSGVEDAWGIATDTSNQIYLAGHTNSIDFDTTAAAYQTIKKGTLSDWYLTKWSHTGTLLNSTLFGGLNNDFMTRMVFVEPNYLMLLGYTESNDVPIIGTNNQSTIAGNYDAFLALFDAGTMIPIWSSYYGGSMVDEPLDLAVPSLSCTVFTGSTNSVNYPLSLSPYQHNLNASNDGMITKLNPQHSIPTKLSVNNIKSLSVSPNPFTNFITVQSTLPFTIEITTILGQLVVSETNKHILSTENLLAGIYFVTIYSSQYSKSFKMVKE